MDRTHVATSVLAFEQARREVEDRLRQEGTKPGEVDSATLHNLVHQHLNENRSRLVELIEAQYEPFLAKLRDALVHPTVMAHFRDE